MTVVGNITCPYSLHDQWDLLYLHSQGKQVYFIIYYYYYYYYHHIIIIII